MKQWRQLVRDRQAVEGTDVSAVAHGKNTGIL